MKSKIFTSLLVLIFLLICLEYSYAKKRVILGCPYDRVIFADETIQECPLCGRKVEKVRQGVIRGKGDRALFTNDHKLCMECGRASWAVVYGSSQCRTVSFDSKKLCANGLPLAKKEIISFRYYCKKDNMSFAYAPGVCPAGDEPVTMGESLETRMEKHSLLKFQEGGEYKPSEGLPEFKDPFESANMIISIEPSNIKGGE